MIKDPLHKIEHTAMRVDNFMKNKTRGVFNKYPITFSFLVLFGVMSVLHGFDEIIFKIPLLNKNPILVFIAGLVILIFTGSLYKRLQKKID